MSAASQRLPGIAGMRTAVVFAALTLTLTGLTQPISVAAADSPSPPQTGGNVTAAAPAATTVTPAVATAIPATTCTLSGSVRTCHLWAKTTTVTLPGGGTVPTLGYSSTGAGAATTPGPVLAALQGETLRVVLHNQLSQRTSLNFPQNPIFPDLTTGVATGNAKVYTLTLDRPGTFLYEAGLTANGPRQVARGLAGAFVVRPAATGTAYGTPATAFDQEAVLVLQEIDPRLNADPTGFNLAEFDPTYRLINGRAFPDTAPIATMPDDTALLRYVNAGLVDHEMALLGAHQSVAGENAYPSVNGCCAVSQLLPAGETVDTLVTVPTAAAGLKVPLYDPEGRLDNAGASTSGAVDFGGMLTFLEVGGSP